MSVFVKARVPESPRWLYIKGKQKEANKIFQRIARSNKRQFNPEKLLSCDSVSHDCRGNDLLHALSCIFNAMAEMQFQHRHQSLRGLFH